jgi:hypothetical protein
MTYASKAEAQAALNAARAKAQRASERFKSPPAGPEYDAAKLHYDRCVRELEECINEMANWETGDPSED